MKMRRIITFFLTVSILLGFGSGLSITAQAAASDSGTCGENLTWTLKDGTLTISGTGDMTGYAYGTAPWYPDREQLTSVVIKNGVTSIGDYAFSYCTNMESISLPDSMVSIGSHAFEGCNSLTGIAIPQSVTNIGSHAFWGCSRLESANIPEDISTIPNSLFYECSSLKSITIPSGVTGIGGQAFYGCASLESILIPAGVITMGDFPFAGCSGLASLQVASGNPTYYSVDNCIIEKASKTLLAGCKNSVIPMDGSVTKIGVAAFDGASGLTQVTIPDSVTIIDSLAFCNCSGLKTITIPSSVTYMGNEPFAGCAGLASMNVASGNQTYHSAGNCIIETATKTLIAGCKNSVIPTDGSVTSIWHWAFMGCTDLTSITIPDGVRSIGESAFDGCTSLKSVTLPDSVMQICQRAFADCASLESITIPNSVSAMGDYAFSGCTSLTSITVPGSIADIGNYTFWGCTGLTSVTLENGITTIGDGVFWNCPSLTTITIPASVTRIGAGAFRLCKGLSDVYYARGEEDWNEITIGKNNDFLTEATMHYNGVAPLSITRQPSNQSVTDGDTAKFTVEASGDNLTYQWQYRTSTTGKWKNSTAASAVTATVKVTGKTSRNGYQYRCVITDSDGNVVESAPATLYVLGVTTQPADQSVKADKTATFKVKATGDGLTYQWQYRTSTTGKWKNSTASTATTATLKTTAKTSRNGYQYRCVITDSAGNVVESEAATLYVLGITTQPSNQSVKADKTAKFKVKATGDGLTYQWQYRTSETGKWKNSTASTATTATLKTTGKTSRNGYQYRCKITDSAGNVVYSDSATLYVLGVTTQPGSVSVSNGTSVKFTVKATGDGLTYQWQYRTSSSGSWKNSGASTATKATIKINGTTSKNGYQYRCKITDSAGNVVYSDAATLKVK